MFNQYKANRRILKYVRDVLGYEVKHAYSKFGHCRAVTGINTTTNKILYEYVEMDRAMLFQSIYPFTLLHEVGHLIHPKGKDEDKILAEFSAWDWGLHMAYAMGIMPTAADYGMMVGWFTGYIEHNVERDLRSIHYQLFPNLFTSIWYKAAS